MILEDCKLVAEFCGAGVPWMVDVAIDGDRIIAIVPCGTPVKREHERMDIHDVTLLPGLINAHVRLLMGEATADNRDRITASAQRAFDCYNYTRFFLGNGYTTIRGVDDGLHYSGFVTRNTINESTMQGPRIHDSGVTIVPVTAGFDAYEYFCGLYSTKEDV